MYAYVHVDDVVEHMNSSYLFTWTFKNYLFIWKSLVVHLVRGIKFGNVFITIFTLIASPYFAFQSLQADLDTVNNCRKMAYSL